MDREPASESPAGAERPAPVTLDDIVAAGRRTRRPTSRAVWIIALVIGAACAIGFVAMLLGDPSPATGVRPAQPAQPAQPATGLGFTLGLVVGVAVGIAIGLAIAHRPVAARHSSRSKP